MWFAPILSTPWLVYDFADIFYVISMTNLRRRKRRERRPYTLDLVRDDGGPIAVHNTIHCKRIEFPFSSLSSNSECLSRTFIHFRRHASSLSVLCRFTSRTTISDIVWCVHSVHCALINDRTHVVPCECMCPMIWWCDVNKCLLYPKSTRTYFVVAMHYVAYCWFYPRHTRAPFESALLSSSVFALV